MTERDLDARLSAWIDGEVSEDEARALEERVANDPEVAARFAALSRVDERLRGLPGPAPRADLRARLAERIAEREGAVVVPLRPRPLRWAVPAAAALAAGIAIYLGVRTTPGEVVPRAPVAPEPPIARDEMDPTPRDTPLPDSAPETAPRFAERPATDAREPGVDEVAIAPDAADLEPDAAELALAFDYDALRDFEVIDQLELLEVLAAYEDDGGGRS